MTCKEFRRYFFKVNPLDCTVAETAGVVKHMRECPKCWALSRETDDGPEPTPEESAELAAHAARAFADPEVDFGTRPE